MKAYEIAVGEEIPDEAHFCRTGIQNLRSFPRRHQRFADSFRETETKGEKQSYELREKETK